MTCRSSRRSRVVVACAALALLGLLTPPVLGRVSAQSGQRDLTNGSWSGSLDAWFHKREGGVDLSGTASGGIPTLKVRGNSVTGSFVFVVNASGPIAYGGGLRGSGETLERAQGEMRGEPDSMCMEGSAHVTGSVTLENPHITKNFERTVPVECLKWGLHPEWAGCAQAVGDWTLDWETVGASPGGEREAEGRFVLARTDAAGDSSADLAALQEELDWLAQGRAFDAQRALLLLARAEDVAYNLWRNVECHQASGRWATTTTLAVLALISRLLREGGLAGLNSLDLYGLVSAAYRTGVIGRGAVVTPDSARIQQALKDEVIRRVDAEGDPDLKALAIQLGWMT